MTFNLASILDVNAKCRPHHPAVIAGDVTLDYAAIAERTRRLAARLTRYGIKPGNRVGLCLSDSVDHILMHFAVARLGACIVPIDHRWTTAEIDKVTHAFACDLVVYEPGAPLSPSERSVVLTPDWYAEPYSTLPPTVSDEALPVVLSLSSGTTGRPTGALVTHRQLYERFVSQWVTMRFNASDRYIVATPLYFGGGRSFAMSFLVAGATLILCPPPQEPSILTNVAARHRATVTFLVPTQIRRLLANWTGTGPAFPTLRLLVTSGAATHAEERRDVMERLTPGFMDYYASSEGGGIAVLPPEEQLAYADTVGRPTFRVEVETVDGEGRAVPAGTVGLLRYRGPGVSTTLVGADGVVTTGATEGWHYPGDLAILTTTGHLALKGRAKDVIIRGGVNIYAIEIEAALLAYPDVAECAVVGLPHPVLGEIVAAAVIAKPGAALDIERIKSHLAGQLAPYKRPEQIVAVASLPKSTVGKIVKDRVREVVFSVAAATPRGQGT
jgi:acyl-CoA synthetase (AMP-forming)/AMP-acid ligase II